jgi:mRNA interferase MazF
MHRVALKLAEVFLYSERYNHMTETIDTVISIQKLIFDQAESLAQRLNISREHLLELALENFIASQQDYPLVTAAQADTKRAIINQGDLFWARLDAPDETDAGYPHPQVVIQDNILTHSRIKTVVVCGLTSNLKRASLPGNVLLEAGEANLSRPSVVVVSQVSTLEKTQLGEYIGSLSAERVRQILAGMRFLQLST